MPRILPEAGGLSAALSHQIEGTCGGGGQSMPWLEFFPASSCPARQSLSGARHGPLNDIWIRLFPTLGPVFLYSWNKNDSQHVHLRASPSISQETHMKTQTTARPRYLTAVLAATLSITLAACASAGPRSAAPTQVADGVLTGSNGMTLYTFDKDMAGSGKSTCNDGCAKNWPPLMGQAGDMASGDYSLITRDDGSKQWALKGKPLYYWVKDQKAGDRTGDGVNKVWHVARP
jgi:predicted lipoprotein with Yx(FWY)xxD motif